MIDLAHVDVSTKTRPARPRSAEQLLPLSSDGEPKTVFVKKLDDGSPGFGSSRDGDFFRDGMEWQIESDAHDLFITFVLLEGVEKIERPADSVIYRSARFEADTQQDLAVMATKESMTYEFNVFMKDGTRVDPKIVVTPL
jgi:hypothetical protein